MLVYYFDSDAKSEPARFSFDTDEEAVLWATGLQLLLGNVAAGEAILYTKQTDGCFRVIKEWPERTNSFLKLDANNIIPIETWTW